MILYDTQMCRDVNIRDVSGLESSRHLIGLYRLSFEKRVCYHHYSLIEHRLLTGLKVIKRECCQ